MARISAFILDYRVVGDTVHALRRVLFSDRRQNRYKQADIADASIAHARRLQRIISRLPSNGNQSTASASNEPATMIEAHTRNLIRLVTG
jgi:hypothetical protein